MRQTSFSSSTDDGWLDIEPIILEQPVSFFLRSRNTGLERWLREEFRALVALEEDSS